MSLQGMLETIPLHDVLALLSATRKSGELRVDGNRGDGRLWLRDGSVVGAAVARASTPVDAVFELLRLASGSFTFESGVEAPNPGQPVAVDALVSEAQSRLREWKAIEAVVPSMGCRVALADELTGESVTIKREQWKQLVAVASAGDVTEAMKRLAVGEFDACRTVKELSEAGLVKVGEAPKPASGPAPGPEPVAASEPSTSLHRSTSRPSGDGDAAPATPDSNGSSAPAAASSATNGGTAARRPAPPATREPALPEAKPAERASAGDARPSAPAPAERAPLGDARPSSSPAERAPLGTARPSAPAPAERAPLGGSRPSTSAPRTTPAPAPAGRRAPVPSAEEADDLVHQLASLGRGAAPAARSGPAAPAASAPDAPAARPAAPAARPDAPAARSDARTAPAAARPAPPARGKAEPAPAPAGRPAAEEAAADADAPKPADVAEDEPINRGMLLKFLSSVRP